MTVVTCCYNSERFLRQTIDSVLSQTFTDFEFIIWNDGSTDSTEEIILSYADERIKYYKAENQGAGIARAEAIKRSSGEYIAVLDSDDVSLPHRFATEVEYLDQHPDYVIVASQAERIDEDGRHFSQSFLPCSDRAIKRHLSIYTSSSMFRREAYFSAGGFLNIRTGQDYVLFKRMAKYGKFRVLPENLIQYRINTQSIGRTLRQEKYNAITQLFRDKIASDDIVDPRDIELVNEVWAQNKLVSKRIPFNEKVKKTNNVLERIVNVGAPVFGRKRMIRWVCMIVTFVKGYVI